MSTGSGVYFTGLGFVLAACLLSGEMVAGLVIGGIGLMVWGGCRALTDYVK